MKTSRMLSQCFTTEIRDEEITRKHEKSFDEILKKGEIYGKITCRKLIVKKGGTFSGMVEMLNAKS